MRRSAFYPVFSLAFFVLFSACTALDPLIVDVRPSKLVLFNNTLDTLYYAALECRAARFMKLKPCTHPELCSEWAIKPGLARHLPYPLIPDWHPGAQVTVYWWHLIPDSTAEMSYRVNGPYQVTVATPKHPIPGQ